MGRGTAPRLLADLVLTLSFVAPTSGPFTGLCVHEWRDVAVIVGHLPGQWDRTIPATGCWLYALTGPVRFTCALN